MNYGTKSFREVIITRRNIKWNEIKTHSLISVFNNGIIHAIYLLFILETNFIDKILMF